MSRTGRPKGARALRDDAVLDVGDQIIPLRRISDLLRELGVEVAHINRLRVSAGECLRAAQRIDDEAAITWDGTMRRRTDHIVSVMEQQAAEEMAAAGWEPSEVAA